MNSEEVSVGAHTVIHPGVRIGPGSSIGSFCEIGSPNGEPLVIGANAIIRSYSNVQGGSSFGPGLQVGQYTLIRGSMNVGEGLQVGSNCELQGSMEIGDFVRIQSGVHLGKETRIGDFVWIFPNVLTVNDPLPPSNIHLGVTFESFAAVAANSLVFPGVVLGEGCFVAAASVVRSNVAPFTAVTGDPATPFATTDRLVDLEHRIAHPWPNHFRRSYPEHAQARLDVAAVELTESARQARRQARAAVRRAPKVES
jgi:acetyltransferase-like isoleucine patch superfamily enzyme